MQLSKRMEMLASMVTAGNRLADIGTDHGYIPIYLVRQGKIPSAIAMDVRKGPLLRAEAHIREAGLTEYIETRLSDGLEKLAPHEADTILLAGMGGPLINRILKDGMDALEGAKELILQPQSEIRETRNLLAEMGYRICREEMVLEEGKFYPMMAAEKDRPYRLPQQEAAFGPLLIRNRNRVLELFLQKDREQCEKLLRKLSDADNPRTKARRQQLLEQIRMIGQVQELYHTQQN